MYLNRMQIYDEGFNDGVAVALHAVEVYLESMSDEEAERIAQRIMVLKQEAREAYDLNFKASEQVSSPLEVLLRGFMEKIAARWP